MISAIFAAAGLVLLAWILEQCAAPTPRPKLGARQVRRPAPQGRAEKDLTRALARGRYAVSATSINRRLTAIA